MTATDKNNSHRKTAIIVGALFLIAMAASLVGAGLIETVTGDPEYLVTVSENETQLRFGVLLELLNGLAVIGIAVAMYPIFKKVNEALALGYVSFRIVEAVIIFAALIPPLTLIVLSQEYATAGAEAASFLSVGSAVVATRSFLVGQMIGIFFTLGALIFYTLLYRSRIVPAFISIWGLIAVSLVLIWNLLELMGFSISFGIILALPMILNEIFLGIWLIAKGFDSPALAALAVEK